MTPRKFKFRDSRTNVYEVNFFMTYGACEGGASETTTVMAATEKEAVEKAQKQAHQKNADAGEDDLGEFHLCGVKRVGARG